MDNLFFRSDDAIAGPRLASALGVGTVVATEEKVHITKLTGRVVPSWIARDGDVPDSDATFDAVEVEPKTIGANVMVKRSALLYGTHPNVEPLLMQDMRDAVLDALDHAVLYGSGSGNEPEGVASQATTGHALASLTDAYLIRNAFLGYQRTDDGFRWLLPDLSEAKLATTAAFSGATTPVVMGGELAGYPYVLNPLASTGSPTVTQQQYLAGNWSYVHLVIFDSVSILANPFGQGYRSGSVELRVLADANVLVRDPKRFLAGQATILSA
jgi:HK97 family phage major capsid protein